MKHQCEMCRKEVQKKVRCETCNRVYCSWECPVPLIREIERLHKIIDKRDAEVGRAHSLLSFTQMRPQKE